MGATNQLEISAAAAAAAMSASAMFIADKLGYDFTKQPTETESNRQIWTAAMNTAALAVNDCMYWISGQEGGALATWDFPLLNSATSPDVSSADDQGS